MYDDAYTLQMVEKEDVANFNFVAGMVPFLFNLIQDVIKLLEPRRQKTGLRGFRPGLTQTDLYSPRSSIKA